jgi:hypothetical protein
MTPTMSTSRAMAVILLYGWLTPKVEGGFFSGTLQRFLSRTSDRTSFDARRVVLKDSDKGDRTMDSYNDAINRAFQQQSAPPAATSEDTTMSAYMRAINQRTHNNHANGKVASVVDDARNSPSRMSMEEQMGKAMESYEEALKQSVTQQVQPQAQQQQQPKKRSSFRFIPTDKPRGTNDASPKKPNIVDAEWSFHDNVVVNNRPRDQEEMKAYMAAMASLQNDKQNPDVLHISTDASRAAEREKQRELEKELNRKSEAAARDSFNEANEDFIKDRFNKPSQQAKAAQAEFLKKFARENPVVTMKDEHSNNNNGVFNRANEDFLPNKFQDSHEQVSNQAKADYLRQNTYVAPSSTTAYYQPKNIVVPPSVPAEGSYFGVKDTHFSTPNEEALRSEFNKVNEDALQAYQQYLEKQKVYEAFLAKQQEAAILDSMSPQEREEALKLKSGQDAQGQETAPVAKEAYFGLKQDHFSTPNEEVLSSEFDKDKEDTQQIYEHYLEKQKSYQDFLAKQQESAILESMSLQEREEANRQQSKEQEVAGPAPSALDERAHAAQQQEYHAQDFNSAKDDQQVPADYAAVADLPDMRPSRPAPVVDTAMQPSLQAVNPTELPKWAQGEEAIDEPDPYMQNARAEYYNKDLGRLEEPSWQTDLLHKMENMAIGQIPADPLPREQTASAPIMKDTQSLQPNPKHSVPKIGGPQSQQQPPDDSEQAPRSQQQQQVTRFGEMHHPPPEHHHAQEGHQQVTRFGDIRNPPPEQRPAHDIYHGWQSQPPEDDAEQLRKTIFAQANQASVRETTTQQQNPHSDPYSVPRIGKNAEQNHAEEQQVYQPPPQFKRVSPTSNPHSVPRIADMPPEQQEAFQEPVAKYEQPPSDPFSVPRIKDMNAYKQSGAKAFQVPPRTVLHPTSEQPRQESSQQTQQQPRPPQPQPRPQEPKQHQERTAQPPPSPRAQKSNKPFIPTFPNFGSFDGSDDEVDAYGNKKRKTPKNAIQDTTLPPGMAFADGRPVAKSGASISAFYGDGNPFNDSTGASSSSRGPSPSSFGGASKTSSFASSATPQGGGSADLISCSIEAYSDLPSWVLESQKSDPKRELVDSQFVDWDPKKPRPETLPPPVEVPLGRYEDAARGGVKTNSHDTHSMGWSVTPSASEAAATNSAADERWTPATEDQHSSPFVGKVTIESRGAKAVNSPTEMPQAQRTQHTFQKASVEDAKASLSNLWIPKIATEPADEGTSGDDMFATYMNIMAPSGLESTSNDGEVDGAGVVEDIMDVFTAAMAPTELNLGVPKAGKSGKDFPNEPHQSMAGPMSSKGGFASEDAVAKSQASTSKSQRSVRTVAQDGRSGNEGTAGLASSDSTRDATADDDPKDYRTDIKIESHHLSAHDDMMSAFMDTMLTADKSFPEIVGDIPIEVDDKEVKSEGYVSTVPESISTASLNDAETTEDGAGAKNKTGQPKESIGPRERRAKADVASLSIEKSVKEMKLNQPLFFVCANQVDNDKASDNVTFSNEASKEDVEPTSEASVSASAIEGDTTDSNDGSSSGPDDALLTEVEEALLAYENAMKTVEKTDSDLKKFKGALNRNDSGPSAWEKVVESAKRRFLGKEDEEGSEQESLDPYRRRVSQDGVAVPFFLDLREPTLLMIDLDNDSDPSGTGTGKGPSLLVSRDANMIESIIEQKPTLSKSVFDAVGGEVSAFGANYEAPLDVIEPTCATGQILKRAVLSKG